MKSLLYKNYFFKKSFIRISQEKKHNLVYGCEKYIKKIYRNIYKKPLYKILSKIIIKIRIRNCKLHDKIV